MYNGLGITAMMVVAVGLNLSVFGCAQNASEKRQASPTMTERFSHDSVTGRVNDIGTRHVSIRNDTGETTRVRVDDNTKMDQVTIGDQVKAFVSEDGYASTIQRVK